MIKLKITILQIGKTNENAIAELEQFYTKKLKNFVEVRTISLKEISHGKISSEAEKEIIKQKEAEIILNAIPKNNYVYALSEKGQQYESKEFAYLLANNAEKNGPEITFIIGGCFGLHQSILKRANTSLSLSRMTFTHELARPILLEQLYRACTIIAGREYHY